MAATQWTRFGQTLILRKSMTYRYGTSNATTFKMTPIHSRYLLLCCCLLCMQVCVSQVHAQEQQPISELIEMLGSDDRDKRRDAAHTLADYGPGAEQAIDGLIKAIDDRDIQIWHDATQALAHLGPKAAPALDALILKMESNDEQRRFRTAYAIGAIGPAALPAMRERLSEASSDVREVAIRAIGIMGPDAARATTDLIMRLADEQESLRACAVDSLALIGPSTIESVALSLDNTDPLLRAGAAKTLAAIGSTAERTVPKLISLSAEDTDESVRAASVAALGRIAPDRPEIIQPLIAALQDKSQQVKRAAVEAWIPVSPTIQLQATESLAKLVSSQDQALQTSVLLILNRFGSRAATAVPLLIDELVKTPESTELTTTIGQIGKAGLEPTYAALRQHRISPSQAARIIQGMPSTLKREIAKQTNDESPIVRELAASTIGELLPFPRDGVSLLATSIADDAQPVRLAAAKSAQLIGKKAGGLNKALKAAIKLEQAPEVRATMIRALAAIAPDQTQLLSSLSENIEHDSLTVRVATLNELAKLQELPKSMQMQLSSLLERPESQIRALAAESISLIKGGGKKTAELLTGLLEDESPEVRQQAMRSLARMGDKAKPAMGRIQAQLDSDIMETKIAAIESLTQLGKRSSDAMPKFEELSKSENEQVRKVALAGVRRIASEPQDAVKVLIAGLKDNEWDLRKTAARELGELEELAAPAVPALLEMLRADEEGDVARGALREIGTANQEAVPTLLDILQDKKSGRRPRYYSLYLLRKMGAKAKSALPVLVELREKSDGSMGDQFDRTISSIQEDDEE